jgi:hypothetical protein
MGGARTEFEWEGGEEIPSCHLCGAAFTILRRRHRCRSCGQVFCGTCSVVADKKTVMSRFKLELSCLPCKKQKQVEEYASLPHAHAHARHDTTRHARRLLSSPRGRRITERRARRAWTCCASGARSSDKRRPPPRWAAYILSLSLSFCPSRGGCALTCVLVCGVCGGGCRARQRDALLSPRAGSLAGNTREKKEAFEGAGAGGGSGISESNRAWKTALNRNKGFRGYSLVPTSLPSLDVLLICATRHATRHDTRRDHGMLLDRRAIASSAPASCGARSAEQEGDST